MQNRLTHELVKHKNIVLLLKVADKPANQIALKERALGDEGVDLLLFNLKAYSIYQH